LFLFFACSALHLRWKSRFGVNFALTMNGGFSFFDFDSYVSGAQQPSAQQGQPHQGPCYDGYDPSVAPAPIAHPYIPTQGFHGATNPFVPPPYIPAGLDPNPLSNHVVQRHQGMPKVDKSMAVASMTSPMMTYSIFEAPDIRSITQADPAKPASDDSWLDTIQMNVSGISLQPLSGTEILRRVRGKTDDVVTRYLPCVEFLVNCQQELRAGLASATQKRLVRHAYRDNMTPTQFFSRYLAPLVERFHRRNMHLMEADVLSDATQEIQKLCNDAQNVQHQGCEAMKNTFLGGMKDGESWGLRKWLSNHGGALHICNDLECILYACQKLDRSAETTVKLSERLRPLAKQAMDRLKNEVPGSYQEISTAHPYLPFYHRLESALKGMAHFDPEDDDVICIDDEDEIDVEKAKSQPTQSEKRPAVDVVEPVAKRPKVEFDPVTDVVTDFGRFGTPPIQNPFDTDGDDDSVIEVLDAKPLQAFNENSATVNAASSTYDHWRCSRCTMLNLVWSKGCCMCSKDRENEESCPAENSDNDILDPFADFAGLPSFEEAAASVTARIFDLPEPTPVRREAAAVLLPFVTGTFDNPAPPPNQMSATEMTQHLEHLAYLFDVGKQDMVRPAQFHESFWDTSEHYAKILRLLVSLVRNRDSKSFLNPIDEAIVASSGRGSYSYWIKHPLCFRDIVHSLVNLDQSQSAVDGTEQPSGTGTLAVKGLERWNMWRGFDLLQTIDLIFLNALAFNGKEKTQERSRTNRMRKLLWDEIHNITFAHFGADSDERKRVTPTRRGETSGFVVCNKP
jgi:hypothetical protein